MKNKVLQKQIMTHNPNHHLNTLSEIRDLMERSSRFISLSGLSGVFAGLFAILGAALLYIFLESAPFQQAHMDYVKLQEWQKWGVNFYQFVFIDAACILTGALGSAIFFTTQKAKRKGLPIWNSTTKRLLFHLFLPLATGGIFCLALFLNDMPSMIAPATLIFYGLALLNASKYTLPDIYYLGVCEILLGLIGSFIQAYSLEFWILGFGVLHIIYGTVMYIKYER